MRFFSLQLSALAVLTLFVVCKSTCTAQTEPLAIDLVSEVTSVEPGKPFYVGLHLQHKEGYHTYWKFPGVVGVPTAIVWDLPRGWKAGEIEWPAPERVFMFKIRAQGYEGEVMLPVLITPPQKLEESGTVTLAGKASWMCCNRDCNPGFKDLSITLPISNIEPTINKQWAKLFTQAKASVPGSMTEWDTEASLKDGKVTLRLTPKTEAIKKHAARMKDLFFFSDDGLINADNDQSLTHAADGDLILEMPISEYAPKRLPKKLTGVLQSNDGLQLSGIKSVSLSTPLIKE